MRLFQVVKLQKSNSDDQPRHTEGRRDGVTLPGNLRKVGSALDGEYLNQGVQLLA